MKTKFSTSLLALAVALAIEPSARAQSPMPVTDAALLQMLATGQLPAPGTLPGSGQQITGVAAGDLNNDGIIDTAPTNVSPAMSVNSASVGYGGAIYNAAAQGFKDSDGSTANLQGSTYGGGLYLQNNPTTNNYGGAIYNYGGAVYQTSTASNPQVLSWYNDFYNVASPSQPTNPAYGGGLYLQDNTPANSYYGGAIYIYGGAIYQASAPTNPQPSNMWYNDVYNLAAPTQSGSAAGVCDGVDQDCDVSSRSTSSSLIGEDFPGDALSGKHSTASSLIGEDFPGEALTDQQLDLLILDALTAR